MAYFECLHELKLIADLMNEAGISGMRFSISETAKWGDVSVGPKIIDASVKKRMKAALKDIQSGKFAKDWVKEYEGGYKRYNALLKKGEQHPIEKTGAKLRAMMPWIIRDFVLRFDGRGGKSRRCRPRRSQCRRPAKKWLNWIRRCQAC